mmetsp:Transcript_99207/g.172138  ORF Transcript_99207/g.172138 Transcript_99207/m.172138 type:complete len:213 (-) Transcript_99207:89-727(-)
MRRRHPIAWWRRITRRRPVSRRRHSAILGVVGRVMRCRGIATTGSTAWICRGCLTTIGIRWWVARCRRVPGARRWIPTAARWRILGAWWWIPRSWWWIASRAASWWWIIWVLPGIVTPTGRWCVALLLIIGIILRSLRSIRVLSWCCGWRRLPAVVVVRVMWLGRWLAITQRRISRHTRSIGIRSRRRCATVRPGLAVVPRLLAIYRRRSIR